MADSVFDMKPENLDADLAVVRSCQKADLEHECLSKKNGSITPQGRYNDPERQDDTANVIPNPKQQIDGATNHATSECEQAVTGALKRKFVKPKRFYSKSAATALVHDRQFSDLENLAVLSRGQKSDLDALNECLTKKDGSITPDDDDDDVRYNDTVRPDAIGNDVSIPKRQDAIANVTPNPKQQVDGASNHATPKSKQSVNGALNRKIVVKKTKTQAPKPKTEAEKAAAKKKMFAKKKRELAKKVDHTSKKLVKKYVLVYTPKKSVKKIDF